MTTGLVLPYDMIEAFWCWRNIRAAADLKVLTGQQKAEVVMTAIDEDPVASLFGMMDEEEPK